MAKRFYFTDEDGENIINDHVGNIRGARSKAEKAAKELGKDIFINDFDTEDIVEVIFA